MSDERAADKEDLVRFMRRLERLGSGARERPLGPDDREPTDAELAFGTLAMVQDGPLCVPEATLRRVMGGSIPSSLPVGGSATIAWDDGSRLLLERNAADWFVTPIR